ncbi:SHOCT domain-containing protein [Nocardioides abyssi]|uniref:SHOCT domain-containing protein n=1 Tax=Nocardioides abyssi TaxID=3058370 RepID=A0ABT8ES32_9ACTN|nr:SHOCT domain-containing protein [Nocardioides abyssi]MDN4160958.1 SHOCT domain-containing protein [Nocardioides abyssi]
MMDWYHDGTGWGGWLVMALAMVAFWALVVLAVVALFRGATQGRQPASHQDPMDILDQRFARGEIDEDEYHARAAVLRTSVR